MKTLKTFEPYGTYIGNQDEAQKIFQELYRNDKSFVQFVDATKQQTTGIGNIGLRELLMEPVQRIPRYTMLWQCKLSTLPIADISDGKVPPAILGAALQASRVY